MKGKLRIYRSSILLIILILCFGKKTDAQWFLQNSGVPSALTGVDFVDVYTGYAVGLYKVITKTTNGGVNWILLSRDTTSYNQLYSVDFVNGATGWVVGQTVVLHTTNGGMNWIQQNPPNGGGSVSFIDANTGLIAAGAAIIRTTNGGANWTYITVSPEGLNAVHFVNSDTAFAVGNIFQFSWNIYRSINGGLNWQTVGTTYTNSLYGVSFANSGTGIAVGDFGEIRLTTNGGNTWLLKGQELSAYPYNAISMSDVNHATVAGASGRIVRTTNGGFNWFVQNSGTSNHLNAVKMIDSLNGWAVGNYGIILHTTNGGITSVITQEDNSLNNFYLCQNYPNPFNQYTIISYQLSIDAKVTIRVYDIVGNELETLLDENQGGGKHEIKLDGSNLSSGVYFYRLTVDKLTETKKLILLK
jgi:photosystem II stability/assembly factor-like uncharacterized protein